MKATDKGTSKEQKITITASSGLSDEEVERMQKEAEEHADDDKKKRESVETKNLADTMVYTTEKMLKEAGEKVSASDKKDVEEKLEALKKIKDGDDLEAIKRAADELATVAQKVGAAMYEKQKSDVGGQTSEAGEAENTAKAEAKDAEFKEKEKKDESE